MNTISDYMYDDVMDLALIGFPGYLLTRDGKVWSFMRNRWKNLDEKGCTLLVNETYRHGRRLSVKVLVSEMFIVPDLLADGFVPLAIDPRYLINKYGTVYSTSHATFLIWNDAMQYACVNIAGSNKRVHRLVATTFIPNPNNYPEVNHKDGNKWNNHVSNLEWCNRSMNMKHAYQMGFLDDSLAKAQRAKLTKQ